MLKKVYLNGHIDVPLERIGAVAAALPHHIELTRAEPGCLAFEVVQDAKRPERFLVSECFQDRAAFEAHQERAGASEWALVTKGIPRHYRITEE
ncbi:putative quinol monooxygenase [Maritalea sp. S77]|uniref:putative quinol monooxygenase n=1 Tax=Maritalea sp. S77 TaxID=3415125 RepID=UPI003C7B4FDD